MPPPAPSVASTELSTCEEEAASSPLGGASELLAVPAAVPASSMSSRAACLLPLRAPFLPAAPVLGMAPCFQAILKSIAQLLKTQSVQRGFSSALGKREVLPNALSQAFPGVRMYHRIWRVLVLCRTQWVSRF